MGKKYYNYRRNEKEMNEEIIFCADDPEKSDHYGNICRVFAATDRTDKDHSEIIDIAAEFYNTTKDDAESLVNPAKIVESAGAWDDIEFINHVYDNTDYFNRFDGIVTNDGAVFFEVNEQNLIETIRG